MSQKFEARFDEFIKELGGERIPPLESFRENMRKRYGEWLAKEQGLAEWFVPAGALKSYLLNSPLFLRLECRHGLFSLFPVSVCLTLSALLWFNTALSLIHI